LAGTLTAFCEGINFKHEWIYDRFKHHCKGPQVPEINDVGGKKLWPWRETFAEGMGKQPASLEELSQNRPLSQERPVIKSGSDYREFIFPSIQPRRLSVRYDLRFIRVPS
jgi:hypothetical protein